MELQLQQGADRFIAFLKNDPTVNAFTNANHAFFNDPELADLRKRYNELLMVARKKQYDGTLTQEEIDTIRTLQTKVGEHPITERFIRSRNEVIQVLNECNNEMSSLLGFNYAQVAAPPATCG